MTELSLEIGQEYHQENEKSLIDEILGISKKSMESGHNQTVIRDQHPKSHGYVEGEFEVLENLDSKYKIGIFSEPRTYKVWVRFSNGSNRRTKDGDFLPDFQGDIRGMAIKLMDVQGDMAISPSPREQDFILINSKIFFLKDIQGYIYLPSVLDAIYKGEMTLKGEIALDKVEPKRAEELEKAYKAVAYALPILGSIRARVKETPSPLEISYWSATPYRFGNGAMKFAVFPKSPRENFNLEDIEKAGKKNYLREEMTNLLDIKTGNDISFDFMIQLQTDANTMKIEDSTIEWNSELVKVATIKIPKQDFNTEERRQDDEKQSFSPWNSLDVHRPLGGVNRARKIYAELAKVRNEKNKPSQ
jgi:catalase